MQLGPQTDVVTLGRQLLPTVTPVSSENKRYRPNSSPCSPTVAASLLDGEPLHFLEFLHDESASSFLILLFGEDATSAATMIAEFRKATEFHYFGHRRCKPGQRPPRNPGLLNAEKTTRRRELREFARLAYRGDPQRRGQIYWQRVAALIWNACAALNTLRAQSKRIKEREDDRIARLVIRRLKGAARVNAHRARRKAQRIANLNVS